MVKILEAKTRGAVLHWTSIPIYEFCAALIGVTIIKAAEEVS